MKFKIIATVIVVVIMLLCTVIYLASRNSGQPTEEQQYEQVQ